MRLRSTRVALLVAAVGVVGLFVFGANRELSDRAADWLTSGPGAVFGAVAGMHVMHRAQSRHAGRHAGVGGRTWLDVVLLTLGLAAVGIGVSAIGYDLGGDRGDFVFDGGVAFWLAGWLGALLGPIVLMSFVDAPLQLAAKLGRRAGWHLFVVMVALYLFAISLYLYENTDDPPALLGLPGVIGYGAVLVGGVILIVERDREPGTLRPGSGKKNRDHDEIAPGD